MIKQIVEFGTQLSPPTSLVILGEPAIENLPYKKTGCDNGRIQWLKWQGAQDEGKKINLFISVSQSVWIS